MSLWFFGLDLSIKTGTFQWKLYEAASSFKMFHDDKQDEINLNLLVSVQHLKVTFIIHSGRTTHNTPGSQILTKSQRFSSVQSHSRLVQLQSESQVYSSETLQTWCFTFRTSGPVQYRLQDIFQGCIPTTCTSHTKHEANSSSFNCS